VRWTRPRQEDNPTVFAGTRLDKWGGSVGEVEIEGIVEVPLLANVYGDPLPYVLVNFGEDDEGAWLMRLDLGQEELIVTSDLAEELGARVSTHNKKFWKSLGKKKDEASYRVGGKKQTTSLDAIHIADGLVLRDIDAMVTGVDSDPFGTQEAPASTVFGTLGVGALGIPVAVLPSLGVVRFAPPEMADQLLADVGGTVFDFETAESEIVKGWMGKEHHANLFVTLPATVGEQELRVGLASDVLGVLGGEVAVSDAASLAIGDSDVVHTGVGLGDLALRPSWYRHANLSIVPRGDGVEGILGYNLLAWYDLAVDPVGKRLAIKSADAQQRDWPVQAFVDAAEAELAALDAAPEDGEVEEKTAEELEAEQEQRAELLAEKAFFQAMARDFAGATASMEEVTSLDADPCAYWEQLGMFYTLGGRLDDAAVATQKGLDRYVAWASLSMEERE